MLNKTIHNTIHWQNKKNRNYNRVYENIFTLVKGRVAIGRDHRY